MANASAALATLADPTRRQIFEALAARPAAVGALARELPVTRSAVSQHLKVLKDAGLVSEISQGTRRIYRLDPRGIAAMREWLDGHWARALEGFEDFTDQIDPQTERTPP